MFWSNSRRPGGFSIAVVKLKSYERSQKSEFRHDKVFKFRVILNLVLLQSDCFEEEIGVHENRRKILPEHLVQ